MVSASSITPAKLDGFYAFLLKIGGVVEKRQYKRWDVIIYKIYFYKYKRDSMRYCNTKKSDYIFARYECSKIWNQHILRITYNGQTYK